MYVIFQRSGICGLKNNRRFEELSAWKERKERKVQSYYSSGHIMMMKMSSPSALIYNVSSPGTIVLSRLYGCFLLPLSIIVDGVKHEILVLS